MPHWDAIAIPGGGVREGGELPPWVKARFDRAIAMAQGEWMMPLSAGTVHRPPPLDQWGFPIVEASAGAAYLIERGVRPERILREASSLDTIGNAFFTRMIHGVPRGIRRLLVITSEFHLPRTAAIFHWIFELRGPGRATGLGFEGAPNAGMDEGALAARVAKERASLEGVRQLAGRLRTLDQVHQWLFTEHAAYRAGTLPAPSSDPRSY
jgi:hypothetical protein